MKKIIILIVACVVLFSFSLSTMANEQTTVGFSENNSDEIAYSDISSEEFSETGYIMSESEIHEGDYTLSQGILDLSGRTLYVEGDFLQTGGVLKINGGKLIISGNYVNSLIDTTLHNGEFRMTNANDYVLVNGDFVMDSQAMHSNYLTAGVLEIKGDFFQKSVDYTAVGGGYSAQNNFNATGTHKVVFSGAGEQVISFDSPDKSGFADVEFINTNINIRSPLRGWTLNYDTVIDNNVNYALGYYKELNLNGHTLEIAGDYIQNTGTMNINGGRLIIDGKYEMSIKDSVHNGMLKMVKANDYVLVNGDFVMDSQTTHSSYLTAGVLEIKGDFFQKSVDYTAVGGGYSAQNNFNATGTHKVVFSGAGEQTISFGSYEKSGFADVEFVNTNIKILSPMRGWKLIRDTVIDNDVLYPICCLKELNLNGYTLEISGDYIQNSGVMNINGGSLIIGGKYDMGFNYSAHNGELRMTNANDYVLVNGDFIMDSQHNHTYSLTAGVLEIKGDFSQKSSDFTAEGGGHSAYNNFNATGTHKIVFSGEGEQTISFDAPDKSGFADVEFINTNIKVLSPLRGWMLKRDTVIDNDVLYPLCYFKEMNLNGYTLKITGDYIQNSGVMNINGGSLVIGGKYDMGLNYSDHSGILKMTNEEDYVYVNGDFIMDSSQSHNGYLTDGMFELKGSFEQKCGSFGEESGGDSAPDNFNATGNHKIVFTGSGNQTVNFETPELSGFGMLVIKNVVGTKIESECRYNDMQIKNPVGFDGTEYIPDTNEVTVSVKIDEDLEKLNGIVLVCLYGTDNKLIGCRIKALTDLEQKIVFRTGDYGENYILKAFYWQSTTNIVPLCACTELK